MAEKLYNINNLIYNPIDLASNIKHPITEIQYPIRNELLSIYNSAKLNQDYRELINNHYENYFELEKMLIEQSLSNTYIFNKSQDKYKIALDDPETNRSEFYSVIKLTDKFKKIISNEFSFASYLENLGKKLIKLIKNNLNIFYFEIEYVGEGEQGRDHFSKSDCNSKGNQGMNLSVYLKILIINYYFTLKLI